jgi:hypothetical protein
VQRRSRAARMGIEKAQRGPRHRRPGRKSKDVLRIAEARRD